MKTLIIYKSFHHQNTEKIAKEMAQEIDAEILSVNDEVRELDVSEYDLIGIGSGIYFGKFHDSILDLIPRIKGLDRKNVFIFSTSGSKKTTGNDFEKKIIEVLKKRRTNLLGSFDARGSSTFAFLKLFGGMNKGKPDEEDIREARVFVKNIINNLE
jgi:flavodoxin